MIAGTTHGDEQTLEFVKKKEQNLISIQSKTKIARFEKRKETKRSHGNMQQNIGAGKSKDLNNRYELRHEDEIFEVEYDNGTCEEIFHNSEQLERGIIKADGVKKRLVDSLKNSLTLNQPTNVLREELKGISEQHTERSPQGEDPQRPYIFYFDNCLMIVDFFAETRTYLAQVDNQMKEEKEHLLKDVN